MQALGAVWFNVVSGSQEGREWAAKYTSLGGVRVHYSFPGELGLGPTSLNRGEGCLDMHSHC